MYISVFDKLIWHTIGPKSFLFGTVQFCLWASGAVNYDYIVTNSINSLLIGSRCIPNGAHTNHCRANLAHASKRIKNCDVYVLYIIVSIDCGIWYPDANILCIATPNKQFVTVTGYQCYY